VSELKAVSVELYKYTLYHECIIVDIENIHRNRSIHIM